MVSVRGLLTAAMLSLAALFASAPGGSANETVYLGEWRLSGEAFQARGQCYVVWECAEPDFYVSHAAHLMVSGDVTTRGECVEPGKTVGSCKRCAASEPIRTCRVRVTGPTFTRMENGGMLWGD